MLRHLLLISFTLIFVACQSNDDGTDDDLDDLFDEELPGGDSDLLDSLACNDVTHYTFWVDDRSYALKGKQEGGDDSWLWVNCDSAKAYFKSKYDARIFEDQAREVIKLELDSQECPKECPYLQVIIATSPPSQIECEKHWSPTRRDSLFYVRLKLDAVIICREKAPAEMIGIPEPPPEMAKPVGEDCIPIGKLDVGWTCYRGRWIQGHVYTWWCPDGYQYRIQITEEDSTVKCSKDSTMQFDHIPLLKEK